MAVEMLKLPSSAARALELLREASRDAPVLVFKTSPLCGASFQAEDELRQWLASRASHLPLKLAEIDVIRERGLARGLTAKLGIRHESPQALLLADGELRWHASHGDLTAAGFREAVDPRVA
jgi:bacillithiol system protein YtxJ